MNKTLLTSVKYTTAVTAPPIFTKLGNAQQLFVKNRGTEFHEGLTKGLAANTPEDVHLIWSIILGFPWRAKKDDQSRQSGLPVSGLRSKHGTPERKARTLVTAPWRPVCGVGKLEEMTCTEPYTRPCTTCQPDHFSQNHFWMEQI
jgi:hypothetical protein